MPPEELPPFNDFNIFPLGVWFIFGYGRCRGSLGIGFKCGTKVPYERRYVPRAA